LHWPTTRNRHLPQVGSSSKVAREQELPAVGRPGWVANAAGIIEVIDGNWSCLRVRRRGDGLWV